MTRWLALAIPLLLACSERYDTPLSAESAPAPVEPLSNAPTDVPGRLAVIDTAPAHDVLRYFSGNFPNLMNHPAIWWTRGQSELVVSGRGSLQRFELSRMDEALEAYRALLVSCRYRPEGAPPEPAPDEMVVMRMDELFPSEEEARRAFTPEQFQAIQNVSATALYAHFSGNDGSTHDRVIVYASSLGLDVISKTSRETIPMGESSRAFAAFRQAVTR
jgi:hypothetical protein